MNADKKKQRQNRKIVPFEIHNEIFTDRDIDQMIRDSLKKEADKLEAELNADPKLTGVGASDDMFQSIVDKLKDKGIWEETGSAPGMDSETKTDGAPKRSMWENEPPVIRNLEEVYAMLPESDRRALQLGWKVQYEQMCIKDRRRKMRKMLRYGGVAAAMLVIVFGLSMTSEANRRLVQRAWDVMAANFNFHVQTDYTGDAEQVRSKSREEVAAMEDIRENLGISAISFEELPSGMEYEYYDIVVDKTEAVIFYSYQDTIFTVTIINVSEEGSTYYMMDQKAVFLDTIVTEQEFEAKIWETNQELDEEERAYIAEIDYEGCRYILNGMFSLEEMKKIVESTFIL